MFESLPEAPVKWNLLVKENIVKASFWAVLGHYGNIWNLNTPTNKLTEVGMIEFPEDKKTGIQNTLFAIRQDCIKWGRMTNVFVCLLPDLFDFLSDGFGQRESLCLNPLDGYCPAVTGEENAFNLFSNN